MTQCKNYYALNEYEIDTAIHTIREWLWQYRDVGKEDIMKARWALHIALEAKEHYQEKIGDDFMRDVIQTICGA